MSQPATPSYTNGGIASSELSSRLVKVGGFRNPFDAEQLSAKQTSRQQIAITQGADQFREQIQSAHDSICVDGERVVSFRGGCCCHPLFLQCYQNCGDGSGLLRLALRAN